MKLSTQVFASLVAALATLSQSAIATPSSRVISQNAIDSYQLTGKKLSLPSKIELQPPSLIAQQSDICKAGTIPVRINAPDNATPAYSGKLQPGVNSGTRCIFFKDVSLSVRPNGKSKTWLVIHGWLNNSDTEDIKALALEVARQNPGDRVLMLDWGEAAMNGGNTTLGSDQASLGVYYAATWVRPIAEAVVDKLKSEYGLTEQEASQNLNIIGHSLGTLMAGEIGAVYSGMNPKGEKGDSSSPINSIIALDPPSETSTTYNLGGYDVDGRTPAYTFNGKNFLGASQRDAHPEAIDRPKKFSDVSRFSRAFVGAKSLAGNQEFASWAHESFQMDFGNRSDTGDEHGRVVKAFTKLIAEHPFKQPNSKNRFLDLSDMRAHNNCEAKGASYFMKCDTVDGKHEGTVEVNSSNTSTLVKFTTSSGEKQQIAATQWTPTPIKDKTPRVTARFPDEPSSMPVSSTPRQLNPLLKKTIISRIFPEYPRIESDHWDNVKPPFSIAEVDLNNDGSKETIVLYRHRRCSNRSCSIDIFKFGNQKKSYNFISEIGTSRGWLEVALLPTKSRGWQDMAVRYFSYETRTVDWYPVKFDGKEYKILFQLSQRLKQDPKNIILSEKSTAFDLGSFPGTQALEQVTTEPNNKISRILDGQYSTGPVDGVILVKGDKYQFSSEGIYSKWESTSSLIPVKKGVMKRKSDRSYWCLRSMYQPYKKGVTYCSARGWVSSVQNDTK
jgi:pimeloyl-ACP methyl ester carboxylesterase